MSLILNYIKYLNCRFYDIFVLQDCQAGLNFASEDEAIKFKNIIEEKMLIRHKKRLGMKNLVLHFFYC